VNQAPFDLNVQIINNALLLRDTEIWIEDLGTMIETGGHGKVAEMFG
jgi:hypothetical protein